MNMTKRAPPSDSLKRGAHSGEQAGNYLPKSTAASQVSVEPDNSPFDLHLVDSIFQGAEEAPPTESRNSMSGRPTARQPAEVRPSAPVSKASLQGSLLHHSELNDDFDQAIDRVIDKLRQKFKYLELLRQAEFISDDRQSRTGALKKKLINEFNNDYVIYLKEFIEKILSEANSAFSLDIDVNSLGTIRDNLVGTLLAASPVYSKVTPPTSSFPTELPEIAPKFYEAGQGIVNFLRDPEGWWPYIQAGLLTRPDLYHYDPKAYSALANWLKKNQLPPDLQIFKKSEVVTSELANVGDDSLRTSQRLLAAKRRRLTASPK